MSKSLLILPGLVAGFLLGLVFSSTFHARRGAPQAAPQAAPWERPVGEAFDQDGAIILKPHRPLVVEPDAFSPYHDGLSSELLFRELIAQTPLANDDEALEMPEFADDAREARDKRAYLRLHAGRLWGDEFLKAFDRDFDDLHFLSLCARESNADRDEALDAEIALAMRFAEMRKLAPKRPPAPSWISRIPSLPAPRIVETPR